MSVTWNGYWYWPRLRTHDNYSSALLQAASRPSNRDRHEWGLFWRDDLPSRFVRSPNLICSLKYQRTSISSSPVHATLFATLSALSTDHILSRVLIPKQGLGGAVRVTAYVILGFLVIANGLLITCIPPKEEKPMYPLPRLDIAKYSKEMEYLFAAGG